MTRKPELTVLSQLLDGLLQLETATQALRQALAAYCETVQSQDGRPYFKARKLTYELEALLEAAIEDLEKRGVGK